MDQSLIKKNALVSLKSAFSKNRSPSYLKGRKILLSKSIFIAAIKLAMAYRTAKIMNHLLMLDGNVVILCLFEGMVYREKGTLSFSLLRKFKTKYFNMKTYHII